MYVYLHGTIYIKYQSCVIIYVKLCIFTFDYTVLGVSGKVWDPVNQFTTSWVAVVTLTDHP